MLIDLSGKCVLVTGGGGGVGFGIATRLKAAGASVIINDIDGEAAKHAVARLGGDTIPLVGDISDDAAVTRMMLELRGRFEVNALINNAGVVQPLVSTESLALADWQRVIDINLRGTYLMSRAVYENMRVRGTGAIVNICSVAGIRAFPGSNAYGVSKAAVAMLTQTMACEFARHGVRVNAVAPGITEAPMLQRATKDDQHGISLISRVPLGRVGKPEEIGDGVAFLCSDLASYITGAIVPIDGGWLAFGGAGNASIGDPVPIT